MLQKDIKKRLLETYEAAAKEFDVPSGIMMRSFMAHYSTIELVHKYAPQATHRSILDVSSGFAIVSRVLKDEGYTVVAVDSPTFAGETTCSITASTFDFVPVNNLETDNLPFTDNSYDIVLWLATIEHLHNSPKRILCWFRRILRDGGVLIIETPNVLQLKSRLMLLFGKSIMPPIQFLFDSEYHAGHHREYTKRDLEYVARGAGFQVLHSASIDTISPISITRRIRHGDRSPKASELLQMTQFTVGHRISNPYDWIKLPYSILLKLVPGFRDSLFIVGRK